MWERRCGWWFCDDMCSGHVRYLPSSCVWAGCVCTWSVAADLVHRESRLHCVSLRYLISPLKFTFSPSLTHLFHFSHPFSPYYSSPFSSFLPLSLTIASSPLHLPLSLPPPPTHRRSGWQAHRQVCLSNNSACITYACTQCYT